MGSNQRPADYEARLQPSHRVSESVRRSQRGGLNPQFVSKRVRECHPVDVKTDVKPAALGVALSRVDRGTKTSQEFTSCVRASQHVSLRVRASQRLSRAPSPLHLDGLPASRSSDTVQRMVQVLCDVQEVATDAGQWPASARHATASHGPRNTVPSIAFAAGSAVARFGCLSKLRRSR